MAFQNVKDVVLSLSFLFIVIDLVSSWSLQSESEIVLLRNIRERNLDTSNTSHSQINLQDLGRETGSISTSDRKSSQDAYLRQLTQKTGNETIELNTYKPSTDISVTTDITDTTIVDFTTTTLISELNKDLSTSSDVPKVIAPNPMKSSVVPKKGAPNTNKPSVVPKKGVPEIHKSSVVPKKGVSFSSGIKGRKGVNFNEQNSSVIDSTNVTDHPKNTHDLTPQTIDQLPVTELSIIPSTTNKETHPKPLTTIDGTVGSIIYISNDSSNGLLIFGIIIGIVLLVGVGMFGYKRLQDVWSRRHYSRMDFLVDGMYDM